MRIDFEARARALVGCAFRPQGRDARSGLDCVGVLVAVFKLTDVRADYRMRGEHRVELEQALRRHFRKVSREQGRPGDVALLRLASDQLHLGITTDRGFVHADARLRRVVETPGPPPWPIVGVWRRRVREGTTWQL